MDKRSVKKLDADVSLLGFGAMRLATNADGSIDYKESGAMIDKAVEGGVNYFDTAYVYHSQKSEVFLGDTLVSRYPRDSFYLATKLPTFLLKKSEEMERMLDESLRRLKTDYIDFYLMHSLYGESWEKTKQLGAFEFMEKAKRSGKVRRIGFSAHSSPAELRTIVGDYPDWEFAQLQVNYADWATSPGIRQCYEIVEQAGLPVIVMEPIRGGGLSSPSAPAVKKISELLPPGVTPATAAFRWAAELESAFTILSGMSTVAQVEENIRTFSPLKALTDAERKAINETVGVMKSFPTVPCTACGYCLDGCPVRIPIDELFGNFNEYQYFADAHRFKQSLPEAGKRPSDCTECGACTAICPQHIDIPGELKRVGALYDKTA